MNKAERLTGLYVITDTGLSEQCGMALEDMVAEAIAGGARIVQYRAKGLEDAVREREARALAELCRQQDVTFLINDDIALAGQVIADGVHLGQGDTPVATARSQLGDQAIIGVSCHGDLGLANAAVAQGADYVAFGRFFPSHTKPTAPPAGIEVLSRARDVLSVPIAAIGGVTPENGGALIAAGADMLAVIHGVFGQVSIRDAAQRYAALFTATSSRAPR